MLDHPETTRISLNQTLPVLVAKEAHAQLVKSAMSSVSALSEALNPMPHALVEREVAVPLATSAMNSASVLQTAYS